MTRVSDIAAALDRLAPPGQKADFDRVGLQVGDPGAPVRGVLVALDLTPAVIDEAVARGASMIVTHHPLLFKPVARVTAGDPVGALVLRLAEAGLAYHAIHTNLDAARDGVSFALAETLGLSEIELLAPVRDAQKKVVTFVPERDAQAVRDALAAVGAGRIGAYDACSFQTPGTGRFRALEGADPAVGHADGTVQSVDEVRLEVLVDGWQVGRVLAALRDAHPYEEPAVDVYAVDGSHTRVGYGALGTLPEPEPLADFLGRTARALGSESLRYSGDAERVQRVAVCGGSGLSFLPHALCAGADVYVTADVTYHRFFEALDPDGSPRIALVDAGHYETEAMTERLLVDALIQSFPDLAVHRTRQRTSAMKTFVPR